MSGGYPSGVTDADIERRFAESRDCCSTCESYWPSGVDGAGVCARLLHSEGEAAPPDAAAAVVPRWGSCPDWEEYRDEE